MSCTKCTLGAYCAYLSPQMMQRPMTGPFVATGDDLASWIRADFNEMGCLRLTAEQGARFWGVPLESAEAVLSSLANANFLRCSDGVYRRS